MKNSFFRNLASRLTDNRIITILAALLTAILIFLIIVLPISFRPTPSLLNIGDVAFQDFHAPRSFSFISEHLTNSARDEAEKVVVPIYLPADPSISKNQVELLKSILNYITTIRNDQFSSRDQMVLDLQATELVEISEIVAEGLLGLSDEKWELLQEESLYLLEQVMRSTIREDQVGSVQRNLSPQISFDLSDQETLIINELVSQLVVANSLYSNEKTSEAILIAREEINPVSKDYAAGEIIVNNGEIIDALKWEALQELGYTEPKNKFFDYLSAGLLILVMMGMVVLYIRRLKHSRGQLVQGLPIISILFFIFLIAARLIIPNHTILPYLFPVAAFGLTIASVFGYETGIISALMLSILTAYDQANSVDLALYYFIPSAISILLLGRGRRIYIFFVAGLALSVSGSAIVISYRMLNSFLDLTGAGTLIGAAFANGVLSISLSLIFQYLLSQVLGRTTALQLMDLSRPDHPLLHELLTKAPGTYQHSLQVANLAEQSAREINGDALLTRVGALYHDVGKSLNPGFFIENQPHGQMDSHEDMDPVITAATIIQHVKDGLKLAKKHRIPPQIQAFISEHHGKTYTRYQLNQAINDAGSEEKIEKSLFTYPGPIPQSKETALLMLADGCEARVRSEMPESENDISHIVGKSIDYYLQNGQLNNADITLKDLQIIKRSFTRTLQNTYHHRIKYPDSNSEETPEK